MIFTLQFQVFTNEILFYFCLASHLILWLPFHCRICQHWKNTGFEAYTTIATVNGILLFTHVAHCSLGLRITDNGGMSKTRFSGMYSHADKVRRQVDRSNTWTFKSFITWRERTKERKRERVRTGVKPLTTAVILFCVVSK